MLYELPLFLSFSVGWRVIAPRLGPTLLFTNLPATFLGLLFFIYALAFYSRVKSAESTYWASAFSSSGSKVLPVASILLESLAEMSPLFSYSSSILPPIWPSRYWSLASAREGNRLLTIFCCLSKSLSLLLANSSTKSVGILSTHVLSLYPFFLCLLQSSITSLWIEDSL